MSYATAADLEAFLGAPPPATAERLLDRATELVDAALTSAMYSVDTNGNATDATVIAAMNKATCAQVESWLASGDEFDELGAWKSYTMAGLSVSREAPGRHSRLCDRSLDALRAAKLIPGTVFPT